MFNTIGNVAPALEPKQWPPASSLGLNDSQIKALETALTKELALIQGPPGTGKTYVGLKVSFLRIVVSLCYALRCFRLKDLYSRNHYPFLTSPPTLRQ